MAEITPIAISIGSNIDRERCVPHAIRLLRRHQRINIDVVSRVFRSQAVGGTDDAPEFHNVAVAGTTDLTPEELRAELRQLEETMGRERSDDKNAPRKIDLDIAYYGDLEKDFGDWALPDPDIATEPHVVVPLADVAPDWVHPESGMTSYELLVNMPESRERVEPIMAIQLATPHHHRHASEFDFEARENEVYDPHFESLVQGMLVEVGEDPEREGLARTPLRVAKAMDFLTSGYTRNLEEVVNDAIFDAEGADEMVLVKDIEFYSLCEHHMLPFYGRAAVAYLPNKNIIGLSKVARIIDLYGRRLQVQERMTNQIADTV
ncbi:MAG: 2-amino-4-hydroxy-6-hydroxymethyldihydropteridine diphosphokinase, partial [Acidimicrobiia bacterium]|nr:2-amino-4-hydroxy-6-hydroxymethyldihydropteridine diphosphokinase [Acidimicrobiia bacterium]